MKYTVKKLGAAMLAAAMCLSFAACSGGDDQSGAGDADLPKIGILQYAVHSSLDNCYEGLIQGLEAAGYKDGETCTIEFKNAQGDVASASQLAGNMAAGCDMIITNGIRPKDLYRIADGEEIGTRFFGTKQG